MHFPYENCVATVIAIVIKYYILRKIAVGKADVYFPFCNVVLLETTAKRKQQQINKQKHKNNTDDSTSSNREREEKERTEARERERRYKCDERERISNGPRYRGV